jgi:hypothetical protein
MELLLPTDSDEVFPFLKVWPLACADCRDVVCVTACYHGLQPAVSATLAADRDGLIAGREWFQGRLGAYPAVVARLD